MQTNRLFIAIVFSPEILANIQKMQSRLKAQLGNSVFRWVTPANFHLTLQFLGETPTALIPRISTNLDEVAKNQTLFFLHLSGLGCFPNVNNPRVLWLGLVERNLLTDLAKQIRISSPVQGDEKPFSPHITLARLPGDSFGDAERQRLIAVLQQFATVEIGMSIIDKFVLYRSILTPKGPIYTNLHNAPFTR